jgi:hypothetical protein
MSWQPHEEPACKQQDERVVDLVIAPRPRDLGGFSVRRALPSPQRRLVGPFIFWDQMGPATFDAGTGMDVRPHPHIGLATVTYLFQGEIMHRDSLGTVQAIRPGAVNLMTAGRGISHSERTPPEHRTGGSPLFGIQSWIALPESSQEIEPTFVHHSAESLPIVEGDGKRVRLIAGDAFGTQSPVETHWPMLYADVELDAGADLVVPLDVVERGMHVVEGTVRVDGQRFEPGQLAVFRPGAEVKIVACDVPARVMLLGGEPMDGPRHIWWNFVSSSKERIEAAKADWREGRFPQVPGESEFISLPEF